MTERQRLRAAFGKDLDRSIRLLDDSQVRPEKPVARRPYRDDGLGIEHIPLVERSLVDTVLHRSVFPLEHGRNRLNPHLVAR